MLLLFFLLPCQAETNDVNCFPVRHHLVNKLFLMHIFAYLHINAFIMMISFFSLYLLLALLFVAASYVQARCNAAQTSQRLMHIHSNTPI